MTRRKKRALQVPPVVSYKAVEKFSKALYGTTGGTCSARFFRPVMVEYASPVWAALPIYLQDMLKAVQKKGPLYIIFGKMEYKEAMETAGLQSLCARRNDACVKFIGNCPYQFST